MNKDSKAFLIIFVMGMLAAIQPLPAQNRNPGDLRNVDASTEYRRIEEEGEIIELWIYADGAVRSKITDPRDGFAVDTYKPAPGGTTGIQMVVQEDGFEEWTITNIRMFRRFLSLMKLSTRYGVGYDPFNHGAIQHRSLKIIHDTLTDAWSFERIVNGHIDSEVLRRVN